MTEKPSFLRKSLVSFALGALVVVAPCHRGNATVSNQATETVSSLGDGSTVNFTIGFTFQANADVHVYLEDQSTTPFTRTEVSQGSGASKFTISGGDPGTTVVMGTAPSAVQRIIVKREMAFTQTVNYVETDAFPAEDHEAAMDKQVLLLQQLQSEVDGKIGLSNSSPASAPTFPDAIADSFIVYNHAASGLTLAPTGAISSGDVLQFNGSSWGVFNLGTSITDLTNTITSHIADMSNPHNVTAAQVGNATAQWNANEIQGVTVDDASKSNGFVLSFDSTSGHIIYAPQQTPALLNTHIFVGNSSNSPTDVAVSGDASLASTGALTVNTVGTSTAANIHAAESLANAATAVNTASTILKRDGSGQVAATTFTGALVGNASTATTASTVTTNANLTGPITSSGNATSVASQTGTGSKFVMDTSPTLVTPNLGTPSAAVLTNASGTASSLTAGDATNATTVATSSNASFFPLFAASSTNGNQAFNLGTGLTFNPSTNALSTTTFIGALTGHGSLDCALTGCTMSGAISGTSLTLSTPLGVAQGGVGVATLSAHGVIVGNGTSAVSVTGAGNSGQVLTSNGASADPTFQPAAQSATGSYFQGYTSQNGAWSTSTTGSYVDGTNAGGNALTSRVSSGITVTAAASNIAGITFTPASSTAVYLITASTSINSNTNTADINLRLTDGTIVLVETPAFQGPTTVTANLFVPVTMTGVYAPGTGSAVTVKIQIQGNAGTTTIQSLSVSGAIQWTIVRLL